MWNWSSKYLPAKLLSTTLANTRLHCEINILTGTDVNVTCVSRGFKFQKLDISPIKFQMVFRINKTSFPEHPVASNFITYIDFVFCDVGIKICILFRTVPLFKWLITALTTLEFIELGSSVSTGRWL